MSSPRRSANEQVAKLGSRGSPPVRRPPSLLQDVAQRGGLRAPRFERVRRGRERRRPARLRRRSQPRQLLESGPASPLLRAAVQQRIEAHAVSDEQDSAATGAELVAAERDEVGAARDWDPARSRARVDVDQRSELMRASDHLRHRLDRPDLIVGEADRDEGCAARNGVWRRARAKPSTAAISTA